MLAAMDLSQFIALLVIVHFAAKLGATLAHRVGQPAVLGELVAGVAVGGSVLGLIDPSVEMLHLMSELGVIILLFQIGLETDIKELARVGPASLVVACAGVLLPFLAGYLVCRLLGLSNLVAIVVGAALTATSVGITARVLSDLGRLKDSEGQIILGAAVLDDVIGLIILAVVTNLAGGEAVTTGMVLKIAGLAIGFLVAALLVGHFVVPPLMRYADRSRQPGLLPILALLIGLGLAWAAMWAGSAPIIGAFAAGLILNGTPQVHEIEKNTVALGQFFVPIFFVCVGAAVDVKAFNPFDPANHATLLLDALLIVVAIASKFAAGYAPFWLRDVRKPIIGVGMIPRGEVGLIFGQVGLATKVFDASIFSAVTLMVMVTTFIAPPLLKKLLPPRPGTTPRDPVGISDLVTD